MSDSNVEETSEQTRGSEMEHTARGRGRKDKSHDALANMEARLAVDPHFSRAPPLDR